MKTLDITRYLNSDLFSNYDISFKFCLHPPSKHFIRRRNDSVEKNLSFRVYRPDKPVKFGIKAYMVSDSSNGYVSKFKLYTGKSLTGHSFNGATYDLAMYMMSGFFDKGYILYCDNYYTSPQLFWDLFQLGTYSTKLSGNTSNIKRQPTQKSW
jgi:hypothetical protein